MDDHSPESYDFHDCSLSTGNIDIVHGGYDPTGNSGMAGDFNPHFEDTFSHSDPFDSGIGSCDFGSDIGISTDFGTDTFGCGIGDD